MKISLEYRNRGGEKEGGAKKGTLSDLNHPFYRGGESIAQRRKRGIMVDRSDEGLLAIVTREKETSAGGAARLLGDR